MAVIRSWLGINDGVSDGMDCATLPFPPAVV